MTRVVSRGEREVPHVVVEGEILDDVAELVIDEGAEIVHRTPRRLDFARRRSDRIRSAGWVELEPIGNGWRIRWEVEYDLPTLLAATGVAMMLTPFLIVASPLATGMAALGAGRRTISALDRRLRGRGAPALPAGRSR